MDIDSCYQLGYVIKPHGLQGDIRVFIDADNPQDYQNLESVFILQDEQLVPFFIRHIKVSGNKAILSLEDCHDIDTASGLKGAALYLPLTTLPELAGDQFYFHEIIGFTVHDTNLGTLGPVITVYDAGPQNLLAIDYRGKEVLLPITDDTIGKVDKAGKQLLVTLPAGLLDIYLEEPGHED